MLKIEQKNNLLQPSEKTAKSTKLLETENKTKNLLDAFIDSFEAKRDYPPAFVRRASGKRSRKKVRIAREVHIEEMPLTDNERRSALHKLVMKSSKNFVLLVSNTLTLEQILAPDIYGRTPAHYAAEHGVLAELLTSQTEILLILQIQDINGDTPLHSMAKSKNFDSFFIKSITHAELKMLLCQRNTDNLNILDIIKRQSQWELLDNLLNLSR